MHTETLTNDEQISRELEEHSYFRAGNGRLKRKRNTLSSSRKSRTLYRNSVRDGNYVKVGGKTLMVPTGEEIIIRVDRFGMRLSARFAWVKGILRRCAQSVAGLRCCMWTREVTGIRGFWLTRRGLNVFRVRPAGV